jgi:hypothetical protein
MAKKSETPLVELIEAKILSIRGHKVIIDTDLAVLYRVTTFRLNEAVKRNLQRFPEDFMFRLNVEEARQVAVLTSQTAMSNKKTRGGRRTLPYVFTEQGVAMLSSVLNSERAIQMNIAIIRTFVRIRSLAGEHRHLVRKIIEHEGKLVRHDRALKEVFDAMRRLMEPPPGPGKPRIGF